MWLCLILALIAGLSAYGAYMAYRHFSVDLPSIATLREYRPPTVTTVYSDDGRKIAEFFRQRRIVIPLEEVPETLIQAFIAAEDSRFYEHPGIDLKSIVRAFLKNLEAGTVVQGGSTITQQVTKSFLLTPERHYRRKAREAILAYRIDQAFSKDRILYLYLNQIYLGHGAYGVQAAAGNYFGKSAKDLTLAESALLAGLPQAPSWYSPFRHPERARERQEYVLNRMVKEEMITPAEAKRALKEKIDIQPRRNLYLEQVPFYTEHIRRYVAEKYGEDLLYEGGLEIHTAVNVEMQATARRAIDRGLRDHDKRHNRYRGPEDHFEGEAADAFLEKERERWESDPPEAGAVVRGIVTAVEGGAGATVRMGDAVGTLDYGAERWAGRKELSAIKVGDVLSVRLKSAPEADGGDWTLSLEQTPEAEGALLCVETGTGQVKAMIGGRDFRESQFNRAIQAVRQPGSAFKPIIYAAALDKGFTPATEIIDNAVVYKGGGRGGRAWKPKNYDRKFYGPTLLRKALANSRNLSTIKVLSDIGVPYAVDYARKLGIRSDLHPELSLALGASGVTLLEMVRAYSVFANLGDMVEPVFVTRIVDRDGNVLETAEAAPRRVIEKSTAYLVTSLLTSVVQEGTGRRVRALGRPTAGKTGTTNDLHDAWFMGYTPDLVTGVWVGYDQERSLGRRETGGRAASPLWLDFMKEVLEGRPERVFQVPDGVVFARIDAKTGLLPVPETERTIFECFKEGTVPTKHSDRSDAVTTADRFFKSDI